MGVENGIFWSEIGSGFGEPGSTPLPRIPRSTPPGGGGGGGGGAVLHVSSTLALQYLSIILFLAKFLPMRVVLFISGSLNIK